MFVKKFKNLILQKYEFRIISIDGHPYEVYAPNFYEALKIHTAKFVFPPKEIIPLDNIKGSNALVGANNFRYRVIFQKVVHAINEKDAVREFQETTTVNDLVSEQLYPVWINEGM